MEDSTSIRVRLRDALRTSQDAKRVARAVDEIGDEASQTSRRLDRMNVSGSRATRMLKGLGKSSSDTRVNLGPFSTSLRAIPLAVGGVELAAKKLTPAILSTAEAATTLVGGGGAAGGVGLLALGQAGGVASLGLSGLQDALGGNKQAIDRLHPVVRRLYRTLHSENRTLRREAQNGMLPGLTEGAKSALRNRDVINRLTGQTGRTLGGLAKDAGSMLGSKVWGRDIATVGKSNTKIIGDLGHAGLNLADAFRHVAVEASPLARWLAQDVREGTKAIDVWAGNARASGDMAKFFREARTDASLLGSAFGHTGRGIINLFGSQDVDGTRTLRNFDRLTTNFERWTNSPATRRSVADALVGEIPKATGALMTAIANNLPRAGALGAETFLRGFMHADVWGKLLAGGFLAKKLGLFGLGKKALGSRGGIAGALLGNAGRGSSPANPMWVAMVGGGGGPGLPGAGGEGGGTSLWGRLKGRVRQAEGIALGLAERAPRVAGGAAVGLGSELGNELDKLVTQSIFGSPNAPQNPLFGPNNARTMIDNAVHNAINGGGGGGRHAGALPSPGGPFGNGTLHANVSVRVGSREIVRANTTGQAKLRARKAGG